MSAVMPVERPVDEQTKKELRRGERRAERGVSAGAKRRLTSRWATLAALVIAVLWTLPTFGLFISSFRPRELIQTTGWWTVFGNWGWTLDNYSTRSEEHTSELQSLLRISYAVFCLKKTKNNHQPISQI